MPRTISPDTIIDLLIEQDIVDLSEPLAPDSDLFARGLDSLALMQLLLHLEHRYGVSVNVRDITRQSLGTAAALAGWLSRESPATAA